MAGKDSLLFGEVLEVGKRRSTIQIKGSFETNGTSDGPDWVDGTQIGAGYSVSRLDVGEYLLTFDIAYPLLVCGTCGVQADAVTEADAQLGAYDPVAKTLEIHTFVETADSLVATDFDGPRVHFDLTFTRRSIGT